MHFRSLLWMLALSLTAARAETPQSHEDQPRGIHVLDGGSGTNIHGVSMRDASLRTNDFVTGFALRLAWTNLEPVMDPFDVEP